MSGSLGLKGLPPSMSVIDFWAIPIPVQKIRTGFYINLVTVQSHLVPSKNPIIVKNK